MKTPNFMGGVISTLGVLVTKIMVGTKTMYSTFFIVDAKPTYSVLLGRLDSFLPMCTFYITSTIDVL